MQDNTSHLLLALTEFLQDHVPDPVCLRNSALSLHEIGIDSFLLMELVLFAERTYKVKLPLNRIAHCHNLQSLATLISDCLNGVGVSP